MECRNIQMLLFFSQLIYRITEHLGETDMHHFITFYRSIITAAYADDEAREMCAFNFPVCILREESPLLGRTLT